MAIIESVPNISEGRRPDVVGRIVADMTRVDGVRVLDSSSDAAHNRTVITLAGDAVSLKTALMAMYRQALAAIDLRTHTGEHPRIGAVDVVPFIPLEGATMNDCVALARDLAQEVAREFNLPVFLYEEAAAHPGRRHLEDIRRGELEGLGARMRSPEWAPDFGPGELHPSGGATVIGARMPLIAFNVNLATDRLEVARAIAAAVRHSSGGFRFVKAMGVRLEERGIVQVSMNLTNFEQTPVARVFEAVRREAARHGVGVAGSEIVGLVPAAALVHAAEYFLRLEGFKGNQVLESRLRGDG